jgi:DNA invertase Pin-like site-specific DNA recombinase
LDLQKIVNDLVGRGISIIFHKEGLTFSGGPTNPMQQLTMQLLGAFSQFERAIIRDRQLEGIAVAQKNGVRFGAPNKLSPDQVDAIKARAAVPGCDKKALAAEFGISRPTLYSVLR